MSKPHKSEKIKSSEITPKSLYLSRRDFLKTAGVVTAGSFLAACAPSLSGASTPPIKLSSSQVADELGDTLNSFEEITNYNNFYEFTTDKAKVIDLVDTLVTEPWTVEVSGFVNNPGTFGVDDLIKMFPPEERIFRLRCVEAWSMVIPWDGFTLAKLLDHVEPTSDAKYVRFVTLLDEKQMPGQKRGTYPWPYEEGLRLDEAYNDLTILATGIYGETLPKQDGAPIRLVVPWKYGFKSIKSIVKIELTDKQPATMWETIAPNEYGFYANVNPQVNHPRWSQETERRIGETGRRDTLMFNGYGEQVADLYAGMDLSKYY